MRTIGVILDRETGGIIGTTMEDIDIYEYDKGIESKSDVYVPDTQYLNRCLNDWNQRSIRLIGIIHSHKIMEQLSYADIQFAYNIMSCNQLDELIMAILVLSVSELLIYKIKDGYVTKEEFMIV
ncbi:MAG: hypothetical protein IJ648_04645 [Lachnospiraceae bacterium]|nr:hypothetical protein [Lachnospiraceae bacterium]